MKFLVFVLALAAFSFAHATGDHNPPPPTNPPTAVSGSYAGITAEQRARAQAQAHSDSRASTGPVSAATGPVSAGATGVAGSIGGNTTDVTVNNMNGSGGDGGYGRVIIHPSMVPPSPIASNPQGNLSVIQTGCMPLVATHREEVYATEPGMFSSKQVPNGHNVVIGGPKIGPTGEVILFDEQRQADGSTILMGNMLIVATAITNQSGGANIAAGFIRSSGSGGQIGGGASAAMQQLGDRVIAMPCIAAIVPARPAPRPDVIFECREPAKPLLRRKTKPAAPICGR